MNALSLSGNKIYAYETGNYLKIGYGMFFNAKRDRKQGEILD